MEIALTFNLLKTGRPVNIMERLCDLCIFTASLVDGSTVGNVRTETFHCVVFCANLSMCKYLRMLEEHKMTESQSLTSLFNC